MTTVDCQWARPDARPSVSVSVSVFPNGFAPAGDGAGNARHFYDELRAEAGKDDADPSAHVAVADQQPGFAAAYAGTGSLTRTILADNAVVTVVVRTRDTTSTDLDRAADELLRQVTPDAGVLAGPGRVRAAIGAGQL
ncbi:hypothetical protein [Actinoplanes sp. NPDC049265]|uniref:hypothetical protein n=1 Tax=Actinoplanes sp. NPDC049265 TaxID=3363902 RepID=UPI0037230930